MKRNKYTGQGNGTIVLHLIIGLLGLIILGLLASCEPKPALNSISPSIISLSLIGLALLGYFIKNTLYPTKLKRLSDMDWGPTPNPPKKPKVYTEDIPMEFPIGDIDSQSQRQTEKELMQAIAKLKANKNVHSIELYTIDSTDKPQVYLKYILKVDIPKP